MQAGLLRTVSSRKTGFRRTPFDLPIWLFFLWTVASSFLSQEPRISVAKIQSTCVVFLFYLTQAIVTRRTAVLLVAVMILSGAAGTVYSVYDLARGRGILIDSVAPESPLQSLHIRKGDAIWRIGGRRVYSVADIDEVIRNSPTKTKLTVSVISQGEHLERPGMIVTDALKKQASPSGIVWQQTNASLSCLGLDTPLRNLFRDSPDSRATCSWPGASKFQKPRSESSFEAGRSCLRAARSRHCPDCNADRVGGVGNRRLCNQCSLPGKKGQSIKPRWYLSAARGWRFRCLPNARATRLVAARPQLFVARSGCAESDSRA